MYLFDDNDSLIEAELSLSFVDSQHCIIVESSGGADRKKNIKRRNPKYNDLLEIIFTRLAHSEINITQVVLDSEKLAAKPVSLRVIKLDKPYSYPVNLLQLENSKKIKEFRVMLGRNIATTSRDSAAQKGGNTQKRIRICLDRVIAVENLNFSSCTPDLVDISDNFLNQTEIKSLQAARLGQGKFREDLIRLHKSTCPITSITNSELLVASHIKPWSSSTNLERLDIDNGILLSVMIDRLFDRGLITFGEDGLICSSQKLSLEDKMRCGLDSAKQLILSEKNKKYLEYHRAIVFQP